MNLKVIKSIKLIAVLFSGAFLLLGSATVDAGADKTINEGESVTLDGSKSTADDGAAITAYTWSENGTVYCQNSQICTIDNLSAGIHHITLKITQSNGEVMRDDVTVTVNKIVVSGSAPVANDMNVTVRENKTKQLTLNASDPDGDALTYTIVTPPAHGKLSGTAPDLTYTPDKDYPGDDSFTYKVNDGSEDSNIVTVSIDIKGYRLVEKTTLTDELEYVKYTYDSMGRLIKKEEGERIGGSEYIDRLEEYTNTYDAQGNLKRRDIDRGGDGTVDGYESFTYDDQGRVLTRFSHNTQFTNPGYYEYTYDTQGHLLTEKDDYQADGDFEYKRVYTYDAQGRVIKKTYDYNYDGTIDDTYTYSYIDASDGGYTKITHDSDASYLFIEKYDANGNITESGYGNENGEITDDVEYSVYTWIEI